MSPPALVTLHQFLRFATVRELMTAARERSLGEPLTPRLWPLEEGGLIVEPWDPDYRRESVVVDVDGLPDAILPPEAPFSRLWMHRGRYLPVRRPDGG